MAIRPSHCRKPLALALSLAATQCGGGSESDSGHPPDRHGFGGIMVYWNTDLRVVEDVSLRPRTVVAAVIGLSIAERLSIDDQGIAVSALPQPVGSRCDGRTPVALVACDVDGDEKRDVFVHDPCGSYVVLDVLGTAPKATNAAEYFPNDNAYPFLEVNESDPDRPTLVQGMLFSYSFYGPDADGSRWNMLATLSADPWPTAELTRGTVPADRPGLWLVQERTALMVVSISGDAEPEIRRFVQREIKPPYVVPFDTFDHLDFLGSGTCGTVAIGVSQFEDAPNAPRSAILLTLPEDGGQSEGFEAEEVIAGGEVVTVAAGRLDEAERMVLGVLINEDDSFVFEAYEYVLCGSLRRMGRQRVDFDVRHVPTPGYYESSERPFTNGVKLAALADKEARTVVFVHYDGYDVRRFTVVVSGAAWTISERIDHVHDTRSDLSVP